MSQQKVVYIGADLHERETQLAVFEPSGSLVMERRIPTSDLKGFIGSLPGDEKHVAIEAVGFVYPIYDALSRLPNCHVSAADPSSVQLIARSRLKHDKADARVLGELLRTNFLPLSHIPGQETREERSLIRDRVRYGLRGGEIKTSIRWLLKRRGISGFEKPFSVEGRKELRELKLDEIDMRLDELELAESSIGRLDRRIERIVANNPKARLLDTLPGVAPYTALFLSSTFDDVDRFPDSKHACAYLGLVPSLNQSGDMVQLGHITKEGNSRLRRNLTECARVAVRKDPHLRGFYLKLKHKRGERKALIAVARKLASYAYWMLKRNVTYEELAPWTASWGQQGSPPSEQGEEGATRRRANLKESGEDPRIVECQPLQAERACGSERENTTKRADFKSLK